jgi:hypothetical protein
VNTRAIVRLELRNSMASSGIEPVAFRACSIVYVVNVSNDVRTKFGSGIQILMESGRTHTGLLSHMSELS